MEELQIFKNEEFGEVRVVEVDGKPYFVANDVAKALGYSVPKDAITRHCKGALKQRYLTDGGEQQLKIIPEGDIYRLIIKSKLPTAEKFERWVFDEVLPTIRKTGGYINNSELMINTYFSQASEEHKVLVKGLLSNIENQQQKIIELSENNQQLVKDNKKLETDNRALAGEILEWKDRSKLNAGVRKLVSVTGANFGKMWNRLYKELKYKYNIDVKRRKENDAGDKKVPYIEYINEDEWDKVLKVFCALCKVYGESPTEMFQQDLPKENLNIGSNDDEENEYAWLDNM